MRSFAVALGLLGLTNAHLTAWHRGMYCLDVSFIVSNHRGLLLILLHAAGRQRSNRFEHRRSRHAFVPAPEERLVV